MDSKLPTTYLHIILWLLPHCSCPILALLWTLFKFQSSFQKYIQNILFKSPPFREKKMAADEKKNCEPRVSRDCVVSALYVSSNMADGDFILSNQWAIQSFYRDQWVRSSAVLVLTRVYSWAHERQEYDPRVSKSILSIKAGVYSCTGSNARAIFSCTREYREYRARTHPQSIAGKHCV